MLHTKKRKRSTGLIVFSGLLSVCVTVLALSTHPGQPRALTASLIPGFSDCQNGIGGQLFSSGGFAQVTRTAGSADFTSDLRIIRNGTAVGIAGPGDIGRAVTLPAFNFGAELVFEIFVRDTNRTFRTGPASRNADGIAHAVVQCRGEGKARVSFEDSFGGGDRDFDDVQFEITTSSTEDIGALGECGTNTLKGTLSPKWGNFGSFSDGTGPQILESNAGEKLEIQCVDATIPSFKMFYTPPGGGNGVRVGMCPFESGCNSVFFSYAGITNGRPDHFLRTNWKSRDYGANDLPNAWNKVNNENPPVLDHALSVLNARTQFLVKADYKYEYRVGPPVDGRFCRVNPLHTPEGRLLAIQLTDPPIGSETEAFFDEVDRLMGGRSIA